MINLLPTDYAVRIKYGRRNAQLRKWLISAAMAIAGLIFILVVGWLVIDVQAKNLNSNIDSSKQQLKTQNLDQTQKEAKQISENVKVINQVLGQEVRFSALIQEIGRIMPPGTVLASLSLTQVNGPIDLTINSRGYDPAVQVSANLSDAKNNLFDKIDLISISCVGDKKAAYPCSGSFKVVFSKDAQTRFLNVAKEDKP